MIASPSAPLPSPKKKKKEKKEKCESVFRNNDSCLPTDYLVVSRVYPVTDYPVYTSVYRGQATYYRELKSHWNFRNFIFNEFKFLFNGKSIVNSF